MQGFLRRKRHGSGPRRSRLLALLQSLPSTAVYELVSVGSTSVHHRSNTAPSPTSPFSLFTLWVRYCLDLGRPLWVADVILWRFATTFDSRSSSTLSYSSFFRFLPVELLYLARHP